MRIWFAVRNAVSEANSPTAQGREMNGTMSGNAVANEKRAFSLATFFSLFSLCTGVYMTVTALPSLRRCLMEL